MAVKRLDREQRKQVKQRRELRQARRSLWDEPRDTTRERQDRQLSVWHEWQD